jgi:hypothetical protein
MTRPGSTFETGAGFESLAAVQSGDQSAGFLRLRDFETIATSMDCSELERLSHTAGGIELHQSIPFTASDRNFLLCIDHVGRMFAPFLFDETYRRRHELELAVPLYLDMLESDRCVAIFTPYDATEALIERIFPSDGVRRKIRRTAPILRSPEGFDGRKGAPVVLAVARPAVRDAFGRISPASHVDQVCSNILMLLLFQNILESRPDARLLWLCPDWQHTPSWSVASAPADFAERGIVDEISRLLTSDSVTILPIHPHRRELNRLLARADFLLDFSPSFDATSALEAMGRGCVPVLPNTVEARELAQHALLVDLDPSCWRRNPLGFSEGYDAPVVASQETLSALRSVGRRCVDLIEEAGTAERLRSAMRAFVSKRYRGYDANPLLLSNLEHGGLGRGHRPLQAYPVDEDTSTSWPIALAEHRFDGVEILDGGYCFYARPAGGCERSLTDAALPHYAAHRIDELVQRLADYTVFSRAPDWVSGTPGGLPLETTVAAQGTIDSVNGNALTSVLEVGDIVTLDGWTTVSASEGIAADAVYVRLTAEDGRVGYVRAPRKKRDDVKRHLGCPDMLDPGFAVSVNIYDTPGELKLEIARQTAGRIEICQNLGLHLRRRFDSAGSRNGAVRAAFGTTAPFGRRTVAIESSEWGIEHISGCKPATVIYGGEILSIEGWMTIAGKDAIVPLAVYIMLTAPDGRKAYVRARPKDRPDIRNHFGRPDMADAGFVASIDISALSSILTLGLCREVDGRIEVIENCRIELHRRP